MTEVSTAPAQPARLTPPGPEHTYRAEELFFSTTDAKGHIRRANSTFMRLAGYERGALAGRPHNVVRHEAMPAGVFRSVWNDIEAGRTASAYITNKSSDSGYYRVFATIIPTGDGYLSVRTLPMLTELRDQIEQVYARVLEVEKASEAAGAGSREVAAAGEKALMAELAELGYADAVDFTRQTLAAEVSALVAAGVSIPQRVDATGPVAQVLTQMQEIEAATGSLVSLLDEAARLVRLLGKRAEEIGTLHHRLGSLRTYLRQVADDVDRLGDGVEADDVREHYEEVDALVLECFEQLRPLAGQVAELQKDTDAVRFAIALLRLENLAAGFFARQLLDGEDELTANDAVGSLGDLVQALHDGAARLSERLTLHGARAELVGGELDVVAGALTATHRPLMDLLAAASDAGASYEVSVRESRAIVRDGFPEARDLADLAGEVRDLEIPDVSEQIEASLAQVRQALAEMGDGLRWCELA